jgi:predicted dehydrogenase
MLTPYQPTNLIRVGVIGLGQHADEQLLPALKLTPGLELTLLVSRTAKKLQDFAHRYQPKYCTDTWQELLEQHTVDALIISSDPQLHYEVTKTALPKNLHLFIEKPPAPTWETLQELLKLKQTSTSKTFVGYNFTYSDAMHTLRSTLSNAPIQLAKFRFLSAKPLEPTYGFKTVLESALYGMFIHPMHTLYDLFGPVETVETLYREFDDRRFSMINTFRFQNGGQASLDWGNYGNHFEPTFELVNKIGEIGILEGLNRFEFRNLHNHSLDPKLFKGKETVQYEYSPLVGGYERTGYKRQFELWRDSIIHQTESPSDLHHSLEIYRVIEKIKEQARQSHA